MLLVSSLQGDQLHACKETSWSPCSWSPCKETSWYPCKVQGDQLVSLQGDQQRFGPLGPNRSRIAAIRLKTNRCDSAQLAESYVTRLFYFACIHQLQGAISRGAGHLFRVHSSGRDQQGSWPLQP